MPSLHFCYAMLVAIFFRRRVSRRIRPLLLAYPPAMAISLVYAGEHYVIDVLVGAAYALLVAGAVNAAAAVIARVRSERSAPAPSPAGTPGDPAHGPAGTVSTSVPVSALTISTMTAPTAMPEEIGSAGTTVPRTSKNTLRPLRRRDARHASRDGDHSADLRLRGVGMIVNG